MSKKILTLDNVPVINKKIGKIDTIEKLKASTIYSLGDVVEVLGFHTKGDGSHHKRVAKDKDDGSGEQGQNGIWWCKLKELKEINTINTYDLLRKLRNNSYSISFTLMGDSIWWQLQKGETVPPYLDNGTSRIYTDMINALNNFIFKGKLTVAENLTFPGDDASRAYTRYEKQSFKGDFVMICYGANDTKFDSGYADGGTAFPVTNIKDTFDRHRNYMKKIIEKAILEGKVPFILGCTAPRAYVQGLHPESEPYRQNMILMADIDKEIAEEYGALYIPVYDYMKNMTDEIFPGEDAVHPTSGLTQLGLRLASNFIGLITEASKYRTKVDVELNLGVRKTFDNFMCSMENPLVRRNPVLMWSNSGEYIRLEEGESIVYSFYNNEDCLVYPQVQHEYDTSFEAGVNFDLNEAYESKSFTDDRFGIYRKYKFASSNTVSGRVICVASPKDILKAKQMNLTGFRGMVAPLKVIPKGFNTVYIKSTKGNINVLGFTIVSTASQTPVFSSATFNKMTTFDDFVQTGTYHFYKNTGTVTINTPPNYDDQLVGLLEVETTYSGNLTDPFSILQKYHTKKSVAYRNNINGGGWSNWAEVKKDESVAIWNFSDSIDFAFKNGKYYGTTTTSAYTSMTGNKPNLTGDILFQVDDIVGIGKSMTAIDSNGSVAIRFYKGTTWSAWKYTKDATVLSDLDTPYYALKMQQEGIYADYVAYRDELHEYENSQTSGDTMMLTVLQEPEIPESVRVFAEKYKLI